MIDANSINLNLFRFFIVSAESNSFAEAGEKLGYSASNISNNISTLEKQLGVKLFTRKPLKLTEIGEAIYKTSKNGIQCLDFSSVLAQSKDSLEFGSIAIGCPSHITDFYLMEQIGKAVKEYPNIQIDLDTESGSHQLIEKLKNNEIDFAILDLIPDENAAELEIEELREIDNIFVSKDKIEIKDIKDVKKLENYKYIFPFYNRLSFMKLSEVLEKFNLTLNYSMRCPTTEQRINACKHGIGIAYILKEAVKKELDEHILYEVKLPKEFQLPKSNLKIVYLKNHLTKVDKEFIKKYLK